ncbi:MAG: GGDEF domain-containing protein [Chromatiales bacterium]
MSESMHQPTHGGQLSPADIALLDLFQQADPLALQPLLAQCPIRELRAGETLIQAGSRDGRVYLVLSGRLRVHLHSDDRYPMAMVRAGESVGEIAIIDGQSAAAYVIAHEHARVLQIEEEVLWSIVRTSHTVAFNLLQILAQRLRYGNAVIHRIRELLREYEYEATIDPLTTLFNRRWLDSMLRRLIQRAESGDQPLAVLMIDLDRFKEYNDTYGHVAGDRALSVVSKVLRDHLRPEDTLSRYGGEELLALLPGTTREEALIVAERLRVAASEASIAQLSGRVLPAVTISVGIAQLRPGQGPESLIAAADEALYRAKRAGRNRISD